MVSRTWLEQLPPLCTRLGARGRDDPKALILSAWVNLVRAARTVASALCAFVLHSYDPSNLPLPYPLCAICCLTVLPSLCVSFAAVSPEGNEANQKGWYQRRAMSCYEVLLEVQPQVRALAKSHYGNCVLLRFPT